MDTPYVYKPFIVELSIYKQLKEDKKLYLRVDSKIDEQFIEFLEKT